MKELPKELQEKRTKCITYSRCMGYQRPIESFNIGKLGEHQERKMFNENCDSERK